jgi:hypothetical protein
MADLITAEQRAAVVEAARDRIEQRLLSSEAACEGETASWADRARQKDADLRTILSALTTAEAERDALKAELLIAKSAYDGIIDLGGKLDLFGSNLELVVSVRDRIDALISPTTQERAEP